MKRITIFLTFVFTLALAASIVGCSGNGSQPTSQQANSKSEPTLESVDNGNPSPASDFKYVNNGSAVQINGYNGSGGNVVIPDEIEGNPVTRIADSAFKDCDDITGIVLPKNLQYIGSSAFYSLENLKGVLVIPETVTEIDGHSFQGTSLTGLVIKGSCKVEVNAFSNISSLGFIYIQEGAACTFGTSCFGYATDLKTAIIPSSVQKLKDGDFKGCNDLTIYTTPGSYAETYANNNFINVDTNSYASEVNKYASKY